MGTNPQLIMCACVCPCLKTARAHLPVETIDKEQTRCVFCALRDFAHTTREDASDLRQAMRVLREADDQSNARMEGNHE